MLEILALWALTKRIGNIVEQKGHKSGWYKVLTVALWFGGEIVGAILGVIVTGTSESAQCLIYLFALGGAAAGAGVAYLIAISLSSTSSAPLPISPGTNSTSLPVPLISSDIKRAGVTVVILGLLLVLCLCPLAINSLVFIVSSIGTPFSIYGRLFSTRIGNTNLALIISDVQLVLSTILALLVIIVGIVILTRIRHESAKQ